jgi:hypothetical protein
MTRLLGLPALLVVLAVGGYLYAKDAKSNGPTSRTVTQAVAGADTAVAATNFQGADTALQAFFAQNGSYVGAALPPGSGVVLVRADASSYCLQATAADGTASHEDGPGATALPGAC